MPVRYRRNRLVYMIQTRGKYLLTHNPNFWKQQPTLLLIDSARGPSWPPGYGLSFSTHSQVVTCHWPTRRVNLTTFITSLRIQNDPLSLHQKISSQLLSYTTVTSRLPFCYPYLLTVLIYNGANYTPTTSLVWLEWEGGLGRGLIVMENYI